MNLSDSRGMAELLTYEELLNFDTASFFSTFITIAPRKMYSMIENLNKCVTNNIDRVRSGLSSPNSKMFLT